MRPLSAYFTAARYAILEQARNRLALGLLIVFVPLWYVLLGAIVPDDLVTFRLRATESFVQVNGHDLTLLTAGINAITLIVGFTLFASTRAGARFDRRLVLAGYRQPVLLAAKVTALLVTAAAVSLYATLALLPFWRPDGLAMIWLSYFAASLVYGGLGLLLGVLVTNELVGFFLIIMVSLVDAGLQNPIGNPAGNKDFLLYFPSFGPMQMAVSGGLTAARPWGMLGLALVWFVGFTLVGLAIFWWRTRAWNARGRVAAPTAAQPEPLEVGR